MADSFDEFCATLLSLSTKDMSITLENHKLLNEESDVPVEGIFYYIWLKPNWQFVSFTVNCESCTTHPDLWERIAVPSLIKHYRVKETPFNVVHLNSAFTAMPRGRVVGPSQGFWIMDYGPLPKTLSENLLRIEVANRFGLTRSRVEGKVKFITDDEHYIPEPQHVSLVRKIIKTSW
jgi:hypothetical protein